MAVSFLFDSPADSSLRSPVLSVLSGTADERSFASHELACLGTVVVQRGRDFRRDDFGLCGGLPGSVAHLLVVAPIPCCPGALDSRDLRVGRRGRFPTGAPVAGLSTGGPAGVRGLVVVSRDRVRVWSGGGRVLRDSSAAAIRSRYTRLAVLIASGDGGGLRFRVGGGRAGMARPVKLPDSLVGGVVDDVKVLGAAAR